MRSNRESLSGAHKLSSEDMLKRVGHCWYATCVGLSWEHSPHTVEHTFWWSLRYVVLDAKAWAKVPENVFTEWTIGLSRLALPRTPGHRFAA